LNTSIVDFISDNIRHGLLVDCNDRPQLLLLYLLPLTILTAAFRLLPFYSAMSEAPEPGWPNRLLKEPVMIIDPSQVEVHGELFRSHAIITSL
jgi:hypothetical protein